MNEQRLEVESVSNPELTSAREVHQRLMDRFGEYKEADWEPAEENIIVLNNDKFEDFLISQMTESDVSEESKMRMAKNTIGYANFKDEKLYMREFNSIDQEQRLTLAHEMLHLWFLRNSLDEANEFSYGVNETLVDTLALEALGYFNLPKESRTTSVDGSINNAALIKGVLEELGEEGWKKLFSACQTGEESDIRTLMEKQFGSQPPGELSDINQALPKIYKEGFWGRFKELALMIYFVRQDPAFQSSNPDAVGYQQYLIIGWSDLDKKYLEELD